MYTFLIIDDEPVERDGISQNIDWESHGYTLVGACRDGREGIKAVEELRPDVVLTDICMPFVDGLQLAAFISDRYPQTKTILLTGYDDFEYAQEAVKLKVSDFLLKPITADELRSVLDRVRAELDIERRRQDDLDKLRQQLRESLPLLRERFLNRLIRGELQEADIPRKLELLKLDLPGPYYNLMVIDPDKGAVEDDLVSLALQNVVDAVICEREGAAVFRAQRELIVVVVSATDDATAILQSLECAEEISDLVRHAFEMTVSIGIGSPVPALSRAEDSFRDAKTALGRRLVLGPNQILTVEQVRGAAGEQVPVADVPARSCVIRALKGGTPVQTERAVRELIGLYRTSNRTIEECRLGMQRLLAEMLSAFESLGIQQSQIPELAGDPFGSLGGLKTLEDIESWFGGLHNSARAVLTRLQNQQSVAKALEAEDYIAGHFSEPGLSLTRLCRALSISKSYFSPMFKAHTGMTFVEYLTNIRMERARELLSSTGLKSYEIAEQVGFTDPHYFSLTFRKQTGVSPTEYRDEIRGLVT